MKTAVVLVAIVIVLAALHVASSIVVPLLLAVTIAVGFHPISRWLTSRGVPVVVASILTLLAVLAVIAGVGFLLVLAAADFAESAPEYGAALTKLRDDTLSWLEGHEMTGVATEVREVNVGAKAGTFVTAVVMRVSGLLGDLFNILLLTVFIQIETQLFERKLELILPPASRERTQSALGEVQKYLRVKFLLSLMNGVFLGGWCWMMGVSNPLLWGVIAFVFNWVPIIGSLIAGIPPVLLGLLEGGIGTALGVAAGFALVNTLVDNVLEARLMGRAMGLSPLVLMVSLLVWGFVLGPVGALLSVPLTVAVRIYLDSNPETRWIALLLANGTKGYQDLRRA